MSHVCRFEVEQTFPDMPNSAEPRFIIGRNRPLSDIQHKQKRPPKEPLQIDLCNWLRFLASCHCDQTEQTSGEEVESGRDRHRRD